ncbi:MAG: hypothetical protein Kapaf2KO_06750 [Candidatus Kapaibacteriales bacterium]
MKSPIFVILLTILVSTASGLEQNGRILSWQLDLAEDANYDKAFQFGREACMESVHLFTTWTSIEPVAGEYDRTAIEGFLDVINIYYPIWPMKIELQIAPVNTGVKEVPKGLEGLPFSHPDMIQSFRALIDTVFAHITDVKFTALNIGNEGDINFGIDENAYRDFKVFLDSVVPYAKKKYRQLHNEELMVGTTLTHHSLTGDFTSNLCKILNEGLDIVSTTYYPINPDFTMKSPSVVVADFDKLVEKYPDKSQPIYFVECGYSSSEVCNSSEEKQAEFWKNVFESWDKYFENIKLITVFKSTDWSHEEVKTLAEYYGIDDIIFREYLRTLGVRTWPGSGSNKPAYEAIKCQLESRNWCQVECDIISVENNIYVEQPTLVLSPNPSRDQITISALGKLKNEGVYFIYNAKGELAETIILDQCPKTIDVRHLVKGVYYIMWNEGYQIYSESFIVE